MFDDEEFNMVEPWTTRLEEASIQTLVEEYLVGRAYTRFERRKRASRSKEEWRRGYLLPSVEDMDWDTPSQNIAMNPVEAVEPMDTSFNWWPYDVTPGHQTVS